MDIFIGAQRDLAKISRKKWSTFLAVLLIFFGARLQFSLKLSVQFVSQYGESTSMYYTEQNKNYIKYMYTTTNKQETSLQLLSQEKMHVNLWK